jgi:hypothetical protein
LATLDAVNAHVFACMLIVDGGLEQEAFGDWKGKKNEMKNAAAELLRSDMQAEKLKSLYEKACKNQPVGGGESVMIDKILATFKPYDLLHKQQLDKKFLERCLVTRVLENNKNANIDEVKREKRQATVKQLQWELLCAWAQQVRLHTFILRCAR